MLKSNLLSDRWSSGNMGEGPGAVGWLSGDINGDGRDEAIQLWANGSKLGIIVYGADDKGAFSKLWRSDDMAAGPNAVSWHVGDVNHDGRAEIIQLWDNHGALGITVYGWNPGSWGMSTLWHVPNMGAGSGAVSWQVGDINGDGKAEIIQLWDNHGVLGITVYGARDGANMSILWSETDMGEGPGAVSWQVGDINGDGRAELIQLWKNGGSLGIIVYGGEPNGAMRKLWRTDDAGQGPGAVSWQVADVDGDGKAELVQLWANGGSLAIIVYGGDARGALSTRWYTVDAGQGSGAVAWLKGNFDGNGYTGLLQLWDHSGWLGMIHYDGAPFFGTLVNPRPAALANYFRPGVYVDINTNNYGGERDGQGRVTAPLYYSVQEQDGRVQIHYLLLYAYQGGQTCRALRAGTEFNCIVNTYGIHQGDLERVTVELRTTPTGEKVLHQVHFEAHGDLHSYTPDRVTFEGGTHPLVHVALNGHSCWNKREVGNQYVETKQDGSVAIVSAIDADGVSWRPYDGGTFIQLGLDASGNPINDQSWVKFQGRLGTFQYNNLSSATYFDGSNLSSLDWTFVKLTNWAADLFDKLPEKIKTGNGPEGPGARDYIRQRGR